MFTFTVDSFVAVSKPFDKAVCFGCKKVYPNAMMLFAV